MASNEKANIALRTASTPLSRMEMASNGKGNIALRTASTPLSRSEINHETQAVDSTRVLQHFEYKVILAVSSLGANAYPAEMARRLTKSLDRHVSIAQVFGALERLEDRGLVGSQETEPSPVRGGRRRRLFHLEASGAQAIATTAAAFRMPSQQELEAPNESAQDTKASVA